MFVYVNDTPTDQTIYIVVFFIFVGIFIVFWFTGQVQKFFNFVADYYHKQNKLEGPFGFGPDFLEFFTIIAKVVWAVIKKILTFK